MLLSFSSQAPCLRSESLSHIRAYPCTSVHIRVKGSRVPMLSLSSLIFCHRPMCKASILVIEKRVLFTYRHPHSPLPTSPFPVSLHFPHLPPPGDFRPHSFQRFTHGRTGSFAFIDNLISPHPRRLFEPLETGKSLEAAKTTLHAAFQTLLDALLELRRSRLHVVRSGFGFLRRRVCRMF